MRRSPVAELVKSFGLGQSVPGNCSLRDRLGIKPLYYAERVGKGNVLVRVRDQGVAAAPRSERQPLDRRALSGLS